MKIERSKEWWMQRAMLEGDSPIAAGMLRDDYSQHFGHLLDERDGLQRRVTAVIDLVSPAAIERFIAALPWSGTESEDERTLVAGNLRNLAAQVRKAIGYGRPVDPRVKVEPEKATCRACLLSSETVDGSGYCIVCRVVQQSVDTGDRLPCNCETKTTLHHGDCASNDPHGASREQRSRE